MSILDIFTDEVVTAGMIIAREDCMAATISTIFHYAFSVLPDGDDRYFMLFLEEKIRENVSTYDTYCIATSMKNNYNHNLVIQGFTELKFRHLLRYLLPKKAQCFDKNHTGPLIDTEQFGLMFS